MAITDNKVCRTCGSGFAKNPDICLRQWNNQRYCSRQCGNVARQGRRLSLSHRQAISRGNVGRIVTQGTRQKISNANRNRIITEAHRRNLSKAHIGQTAWNKGKRFDAIRGERHWAWKGGQSKGYRLGYYSFEYKSWRMAVFERDNYTCQHCRAHGCYLTAHHIKSFAYYPAFRFDISNGITLCEKCHSKTDNYKGRAKRFA